MVNWKGFGKSDLGLTETLSGDFDGRTVGSNERRLWQPVFPLIFEPGKSLIQIEIYGYASLFGKLKLKAS
jgi:hypothetical protein